VSSKIRFNRDLRTYSASARSAFTRTALKKMGSWPAYAAVTGSALAMATSASAGSIVPYTGGPVTVNLSSPGHKTASIDFPQHGFYIALERNILEDFQIGLAVIAPAGRQTSTGGHSVFGMLASGNFIEQLPGNSPVSAGAGAFTNVAQLAQHVLLGGQTFGAGGWQSGVTGYAGFRFKTGGTTDYGWFKLVYSDVDGLPGSLTFLGGAFDDTGAAILTGSDVPSGTPEPGTASLALLALGAAGVVALRRRKDQAAQ
jgi:MYXO-CTERM domain-containing protein